MDDDSAKQKGLLLFICLGIVTCVGRFVQTADDLNARLVCESNAVVAVEDPARLFGRPSLPGLLCYSTYLILTLGTCNLRYTACTNSVVGNL